MRSVLLKAGISAKQARSIKYRMTIAKLPLAKEIADFDFAATPINEALVRDLATGGFLTSQRNAVLVGGTGTGKTHLAIAIGRACVRGGARVRFYNTVDLVNRLEARPRRTARGVVRGSLLWTTGTTRTAYPKGSTLEADPGSTSRAGCHPHCVAQE